MRKYTAGIIAAAVLMTGFSATAYAGEMTTDPEKVAPENAKLISIREVQANGETFRLPLIEYADGTICSSYIETFQKLAYGESVYTIGKRCYQRTPRTERT